MSSTKSRKPKNRFTLCCFCVGSSNSETDLSVQLDCAERCDYVVEKLAIKKVPIALFATDEDLAEMRTNNLLEKYNNKYEKSPPKEAEALISSYYAMIKKNEEGLHRNLGIPKIPKDNFTNTVPDVFKSKRCDDTQSVAINTDKNTIQETCENLLKKCYNQIVHADIHEEPGQRIALSPELRQTLEVLGTKQPTIKANMKQKRSENIVPPVDVYAIQVEKRYQKSPEPIIKNCEEFKYRLDDIVPEQNHSIPIVRKTSNLINQTRPFSPTKKVQSTSKMFQQRTENLRLEDDVQTRTYPNYNTKKVSAPQKVVSPKPEGLVVEQDVQTRLTCQQLDSLINGISGISGDAPSKSSSQRWKIIIKERERETTTSTTSATSTTTTSSTSETDETTSD